MVEQLGRLGAGGTVGLQLLEVFGHDGGPLLECYRGACAIDWRDPLHRLHLRVGAAGDGGGGADAAGVEADDVVSLLHSGEGRRRHRADVVHPGSAGAAGVHEEGALAHRAGGQVLLHRDLNGLPVRLGVVQRHSDLGALKTGLLSRLLHPGSGHAVVPLDLLTIEGLQPLGHRRLGRRCRSRPHSGQRSSGDRTGPHPQTHTRHRRQHPGRHPTASKPSGASPRLRERRHDPIPWMMLRSRFHTQHGMNRSVGV